MKTAKLISKILGTALGLVMIAAMLEGLLATPFPFNKFAHLNRALAQETPQLEWSKTFGGEADDMAWSIEQTSDGGYIITGSTASYGANDGDVWLIKTDSGGNKVWDKTFYWEDGACGYSVQETSDGGYIIAGQIMSPPYDLGYQTFLIKTDSGGNKVWDKTFCGIGLAQSYSVDQTSDGGYVMTGLTAYDKYHDGDVWLIKTDSVGNKIWEKALGGTGDDQGLSVQQTSDGGYIIIGERYTSGTGYRQALLIKTDSAGNEVWDKTFGGVGAVAPGYSVHQTSDGGYVITGATASPDEESGDLDAWLAKTDSSGDKVWEKTSGGAGLAWSMSVDQASDGGYIMAGMTASNGRDDGDVWLAKTDSGGNEVWDMTFGGAAEDWGWSVQQTSDGGYIMAGYTSSYGAGQQDVWLIKVSPEGGVSNNLPNALSNPSPANHATGVSISADLSWTGGDPDAGDTVTYNVYFGTSPTGSLVSHNQAATNYDPGTLTYNTKYYWKIVATDDHGASTTGPLCDFTTQVAPSPSETFPWWWVVVGIVAVALLIYFLWWRRR